METEEIKTPNKLDDDVNQEKVKTLRECFNKIDANLDGLITIDEAKEAYEKYGGVWNSARQADFESCDTNGDGKIDFEEFFAKFEESKPKSKEGTSKDEETKKAYCCSRCNS